MTVTRNLIHFKIMGSRGHFGLLKVRDNEPPPLSSGHYFASAAQLLMPCRTKQP